MRLVACCLMRTLCRTIFCCACLPVCALPLFCILPTCNHYYFLRLLYYTLLPFVTVVVVRYQSCPLLLYCACDSALPFLVVSYRVERFFVLYLRVVIHTCVRRVFLLALYHCYAPPRLPPCHRLCALFVSSLSPATAATRATCRRRCRRIPATRTHHIYARICSCCHC